MSSALTLISPLFARQYCKIAKTLLPLLRLSYKEEYILLLYTTRFSYVKENPEETSIFYLTIQVLMLKSKYLSIFKKRISGYRVGSIFVNSLLLKRLWRISVKCFLIQKKYFTGIGQNRSGRRHKLGQARGEILPSGAPELFCPVQGGLRTCP